MPLTDPLAAPAADLQHFPRMPVARATLRVIVNGEIDAVLIAKLFHGVESLLFGFTNEGLYPELPAEFKGLATSSLVAGQFKKVMAGQLNPG
jgi:hypothetical protein